jgi:streptomycin 6-kinase
VRVPQALRAEWRGDTDWLASLPRLVEGCAERWKLALEEPFATPRSFVVPAGDVVLKLNAPGHREADHEADALARWAARGAVRLVERDDERRALLIERCRPGTPLTGSAVEHDVVADLLARLSVEPAEPHPFRSLADEADRWAHEVPRRYELGGRPFEPALVELAVEVFRTADRGASHLVNQDLHGGNVLRAEREPWLVIDPKPLVGEPELDGVGLLRNAARRGGAAAVRRWLDVLAELGLDRARTRAWGVAHALAWGWDDARGWSPRAIAAARSIVSAR